MKTWQLQHAKAHFSEVIESAVKEGPQLITRRGIETAVLVRIEEWNRLLTKHKSRELSNEERLEHALNYLQSAPDFTVPARGKVRMRKPVGF
jgi:prevent-host-death family protein